MREQAAEQGGEQCRVHCEGLLTFDLNLTTMIGLRMSINVGGTVRGTR